MVTGAASSQEQLAVAAQNAVKTIIQLAEVVKSGAASLGKENSESQVRWNTQLECVRSISGIRLSGRRYTLTVAEQPLWSDQLAQAWD